MCVGGVFVDGSVCGGGRGECLWVGRGAAILLAGMT